MRADRLTHMCPGDVLCLIITELMSAKLVNLVRKWERQTCSIHLAKPHSQIFTIFNLKITLCRYVELSFIKKI